MDIYAQNSSLVRTSNVPGPGQRTGVDVLLLAAPGPQYFTAFANCIAGSKRPSREMEERPTEINLVIQNKPNIEIKA